MNVWEASVRATHSFLKEEDILLYKKQIVEIYLDAVTLFAVRDETNKILGFMGTSDDKIEMLFICPEMRGKGIGKALMDHAIKELQLRKVDVNEQNEPATGFYCKMGFEIKGRSKTDAAGKPYPILHLELPNDRKR
jgi:putative acetyltransferase